MMTWGCPQCGSSLDDTGQLCEHQRHILEDRLIKKMTGVPPGNRGGVVVTMPAAPPPEWIDKVARAHWRAFLEDSDLDSPVMRAMSFDAVPSWIREREIGRITAALGAIWPDVLAVVAAHEQQLRQTIADEIEVFADNFDTGRGDDEWPIGDGYWSGLRRAATIARGQVSS